jgi:outer membrane protein
MTISGGTAQSETSPQSGPLTLAQAQRIALLNHPDMKERLFDQFAAREAIKIAKSGYAPQAYGEGVKTVDPPGTRLSAYSALSDPTIIARTALGVGVSQYITDFGRTNDLVQASEFERKAQDARADLTRAGVLLNVTQAYFEVLRAQALLVVAKETRQERGTLLSQVSVLQRAGLRSTLDVVIAERDVSVADQLLLEAQAHLRKGFAALSETMGSVDLHTYILEDMRRLPDIPGTLDALSIIAVRKNPALISLEARKNAAGKRADAVARLKLPTVTGYGFFGATPIHAMNQSIASSYAAAGVTLSVPLYNGGALAAQKRQAADTALAAEQRLDSERDKLLRDVRSAYDDVRAARGNISVSEERLKAARKALDFTQARYRIGLSSIVDVSEAQLSETQAAISRTNATYDYIVQEAGLAFAAGILDAV